MSLDLPRRALVAHRGLAATWPENTLEALSASLASGVPFVEFDLQLSADGVPVLMHDPSLARTTGTSADVRDLSLDALRELRAGHAERFADKFAHVRIPTLAEAVALLGAPPALSLVEVKRQSVERFGVDAVMRPVLDAIEPLRDRAVVISFEPAVLVAARNEGWPIGLCLAHHGQADLAVARGMAPDLLLVDQLHLRSVEDVWPGPWRLGCWEVTTPERALELLALGVDFVESMLPEQLLADQRVASALAQP